MLPCCLCGRGAHEGRVFAYRTPRFFSIAKEPRTKNAVLRRHSSPKSPPAQSSKNVTSKVDGQIHQQLFYLNQHLDRKKSDRSSNSNAEKCSEKHSLKQREHSRANYGGRTIP